MSRHRDRTPPRHRPTLESLEGRFTPAGTLDPAFLGGAPVAWSLPAGLLDAHAAGAVTLPDRTLIVAGTASRGATATVGIVTRLLPDGQTDPAFGDGGVVVLDLDRGLDLSAVAALPDGRVVVGGTVRAGGEDRDFVAARLDPGGTLDRSFGQAGWARVKFDLTAGGLDACNALAVAPDGSVVLAGSAATDASGHGLFAVARLTPDGQPDPTFDGDGRTAFDIPGRTWAALFHTAAARGVAVTPDGSVVVAGFADGAPFDFAVARLGPAGGLDPAFGSGGIATVDFGFARKGRAEGVVVQTNGRVVVGGSVFGTTYDFAAARLDAQGRLDPTFGTGGRAVVAFNLGGAMDDVVRAVALRPDGVVVLAGASSPASGGGADFAVATLDSLGRPTPALTAGARATVAFNQAGRGVDIAQGLVVQADGRVVLVGSVTADDGNHTTWGAARLDAPPPPTRPVAPAPAPAPSAGPGILVYDPASGVWYLRQVGPGAAPTVRTFAYGAPGWRPVVGDWDGDGVETVGVVDPATATWYLRDSNTAGAPDHVFQYGLAGWTPLVGDWDGDGRDGVGLYDPTSAVWYLRNTPSGGAPDHVFQYGLAGWTPLVGDWDGDGRDGVGLYDPTSAVWYLRNAPSGGAPDVAPFQYGAPGWLPVIGDWSGDRRDGVGLVDPLAGTWYLRDRPSGGAPDFDPFVYGLPGWLGLGGWW